MTVRNFLIHLFFGGIVSALGAFTGLFILTVLLTFIEKKIRSHWSSIARELGFRGACKKWLSQWPLVDSEIAESPPSKSRAL